MKNTIPFLAIGLTLTILFTQEASAQDLSLDAKFGKTISVEASVLSAQTSAFCAKVAPLVTQAYGQVVFSIPDCAAAKTEIRQNGSRYYIVNYPKSYYGNRDLIVVAEMIEQNKITSYTGISVLGLDGE
jgi:hypothetical protein